MKRKSTADFSKIGENISLLMSKCGIDATQLSKYTGLPASTISRLRFNSHEFSPNLSSLIPIAEFFRITLSQLIGESPIQEELFGIFDPGKRRHSYLPILTSQNIERFIKNNEYDHDNIVEIDFSVSEFAFAFFLQGNAMEPQFSENTLLIVDPKITIQNLDFVLVLPFGKKIPIFRQILIDGEENYLRTLNPTFNEFVKMTPDQYSVLGVMVQARRNFRQNVELETYKIKNIAY